jgi:hypothetical protein
LGINVISWDTVVDKKVKSSDGQDLGKVHTITNDFVQTKEGVVSKNYYFIPKYYVQGYDGKDVWISLTKEDIKTKFERDNAPTDLKTFLPAEYDETRAATIKKFPEFENQIPEFSPVGKEPGDLIAQKDKLVIPWKDVIGKKVKSIDENDVGEVKSVFSAFIEVEEGLLRKDRYYIPKYYIEGYDKENYVISSLTKEDIKENYQRNGPPLESELDTQEYLRRKQAQDDKYPHVFVNGIPFMAKEPGVLLESERTGDILNIPWEEVIFKRLKTSDEVDIGDIETVANEYVVIREGVGKIRRYYIPKTQINNYDGSALYITVPAGLVSAKFERDSPPTPNEIKTLSEDSSNVT